MANGERAISRAISGRAVGGGALRCCAVALALVSGALVAADAWGQAGGGAKGGGGPQPGDVIEGAAKALEGDSLLIDGQEIRLFGIDAPDAGQTCQNLRGATYDCYATASKELDAVLKDQVARCVVKLTPRKERTLATCTVQGKDIAAIMVRVGWALAYRRLTFDYVRDEALAASHRAGMWAGRVVPPWQWRDEQAAQKARTAH